MKRKVKSQNIIKHVQPLCVLTQTNEAVEDQVRDHKLTFFDAIEEFTTFKASEKEKKYMLDDTDYASYESLNRLASGRKPKSDQAKRSKKSRSDPIKRKMQV